MLDSSLSQWKTRLAAADPTLSVYLMGIGGAGLSAIATVLAEMGLRVLGSDREAGPRLQPLLDRGVRIFTGQHPQNLIDLAPDHRPDVVLISSAIGPENPERRAAEELGIPVVKRDHFLPVLLANRKLIAIAGAHGKSTTTAMTVLAFRDAGMDVGYIIGADLPGYGNAGAGTSPYFVLEADEYDHMFLGLTPTIGVITNVEWDHPDCFPTPESFQSAFQAFAQRILPGGLAISCADDPGAEKVRNAHANPGLTWRTYGQTEDAHLRTDRVRLNASGGYAADLTLAGQPWGSIDLQTPGRHNLWNSLAVLLTAQACGIDRDQAAASLGRFSGTGRRFEFKGSARGVQIFDDYAHHPTEVRATLAAARGRFPQARIWAVLQPHTYSRTRTLLTEMATSFEEADRVLVTDIYASREQDDGSVHARDLVAASDHPHIRHVSGLEAMADLLAQETVPGDVVLTLGAGDGYRIGEMLLALKREGEGEHVSQS